MLYCPCYTKKISFLIPLQTLTPESDELIISLHSITPETHSNVTRTKEMIVNSIDEGY